MEQKSNLANLLNDTAETSAAPTGVTLNLSTDGATLPTFDPVTTSGRYIGAIVHFVLPPDPSTGHKRHRAALIVNKSSARDLAGMSVEFANLLVFLDGHHDSDANVQSAYTNSPMMAWHQNARFSSAGEPGTWHVCGKTGSCGT